MKSCEEEYEVRFGHDTLATQLNNLKEMTEVQSELRLSSLTPRNMSLIKPHVITEDMKESVWMNSDGLLIRTFIDFLVLR